jgi:tRNA-specific 2-thiouridylase
VLEVRPVSNTVVVGPKEALATAEIAGERLTWTGLAPETSDFSCDVQIRAHADPVPARAVIADGVITVRPEHPLDGVAPGQTAVIYAGTRVLGQFTIDRTVSAVAAPV